MINKKFVVLLWYIRKSLRQYCTEKIKARKITWCEIIMLVLKNYNTVIKCKWHFIAFEFWNSPHESFQLYYFFIHIYTEVTRHY